MAKIVSTTIATVNVTTASTTIVTFDEDHNYINLTNKGNKDCWINIGAAAVSGQGFRIEPGDTHPIINLDEDSDVEITGDINGITPSGSTDIASFIGKRN